MNREQQAMLELLAGRNPQIATFWRDLELIRQAGNMPRLVLCGMLNAGKSSTGRNLTGHDFVIGPCRTTTRNRTEDWEGFRVTDTPGLDADASDESLAEEAIAASDGVLFVHDLRHGGLDALERDFLQTQALHDPQFGTRVLLVLTCAEGLTEAERDSVVTDLCAQVTDLLGACPPYHLISNTSYASGVSGNKPALRAAGGVDALKVAVRAMLPALDRLRQDRVSHLAEALDNMLAAEQIAYQQQLERLKSERDVRRKALREDVACLAQACASRIVRLDEHEREGV